MPGIGRPIDEVAEDFLIAFDRLKDCCFDPNMVNQKATWIVRATNLQKLAEIADEVLELAIEKSRSIGDRVEMEVQMQADQEVFLWRRIQAVLQTAQHLNPPTSTLIAEPLTPQV